MCKVIFLGTSSLPCDLGCIYTMPKFWSMPQEKEIYWTSYFVLSSPKQCVDCFSSSYFDQTNMASTALFWLSKYFLCLSSHFKLHESSSLNCFMELFFPWTLAYSFKRFVSFLFLFQTCFTISFFLDAFLDPSI